MLASVRRIALLLLSLAALAYVGVCVLLGVFQARLIWFPGKDGGTTPRDEGLAFEDLTLATPDGERIHAWFLPAHGEARGALLFSHGNAGTIEDRLDLARFFVEAQVSVLLYDYRGYGRSSGSPSEAGTYADARGLEGARRTPRLRAGASCSTASPSVAVWPSSSRPK